MGFGGCFFLLSTFNWTIDFCSDWWDFSFGGWFLLQDFDWKHVEKQYSLGSCKLLVLVAAFSYPNATWTGFKVWFLQILVRSWFWCFFFQAKILPVVFLFAGFLFYFVKFVAFVAQHFFWLRKYWFQIFPCWLFFLQLKKVSGDLRQRAMVDRQHRNQIAWMKLNEHKDVSVRLRLKFWNFFDSVIAPRSVFGLMTCPLISNQLQNLEVLRNRVLRSIVGWAPLVDNDWHALMQKKNWKCTANIQC